MNTLTMEKTIKALLIDDHIMVQLGLKDGINRRDDLELAYTARSGLEGLQQFATFKPDVVLLDYRLPDIDGIEVAKRLVAINPEARILMLSAFESEEDVWRAVNAGVLGYLPKHCEIAEICEAMRVISRGGRYFPEKFLTMIEQRASRRDLSKREFEVLQLIASGMSNKEIMDHLTLSLPTVRNHVSSVLAKLGTKDRTQAVVKAIRRGIIHLDD